MCHLHVTSTERKEGRPNLNSADVNNVPEQFTALSLACSHKTSMNLDNDVSTSSSNTSAEQSRDVESQQSEEKVLSPPGTDSENEPSCQPRIVELYSTSDWWSLWIGLATFAGAIAAVFGLVNVATSARLVIPQPMTWKHNPLDAWDVYNGIGTWILLGLMGGLYTLKLCIMGSKKPVREHLIGFAAMSILAVLSFWGGRNEWCSDQGLGYAVWSILLGMFCANVPGLKHITEEYLLTAAKDGEFFIKCSLVLLAVQYDVLLEVGTPGILVSWVGSPLAVIGGYLIATKLFGMEERLAVLVAVGSAWCGASAISAVAPIVAAKPEDVALSISVVAFFTVGFTFLQPYLAMGVGMDDEVAGAWIGASVDQTGNVVVSAAIMSDEATEVASIVKMVLNAGLGLMSTAVGVWWNSRQTGEDRKPITLLSLWDKFPKFVLGFLITSGILTGMMQAIDGTKEGDALPVAISSLNKWWFAIAFVGIGLTTNVAKLWTAAKESGIIPVYLCANTLDMALALGLAYLLF